ncbi:Arginine biosynthesis bifunctional protein ArgJ, mitochondrial [Savitreella phatthalungensis]
MLPRSWRASLKTGWTRITGPQDSSAASARRHSTTETTSNKSRFVPQEGIYPRGFSVGGIHCGVKKNGRPDLAIVASRDHDCNAAAVFTKNIFQAAPVTTSRKVLEARSGRGLRAIITNSGCANAVTGQGGLEDANKMGRAVDDLLDRGSDADAGLSSTLVMSTGVIGQRLPIDRIIQGIPKVYKHAGDSHDHWLDCAKAYCTTDTFPKLVSKSIRLPSLSGEGEGIEVRMAGITKGAGMIHPDMATLLGFIATDAAIGPDACKSILKHAVERSFNSISVDGDMSTNDTVCLLANAASLDGSSDTTYLINDDSHPHYTTVRDAVTAFAVSLAQLVVRDGEGATKFVTVRVEDAGSYEDARQVASTIATSALVKTALYGQDANWGRILCATGYAGVQVDPTKTDVLFTSLHDNGPDLPLLIAGEPENVDEARAADLLAQEDVEIVVKLGTGKGHSATYWTCDFSHEYVTINGDYRT